MNVDEQAAPGGVALLHYTCPPVVGGVEAVMAAHARLLAGAGYQVKIIAGRGPAPLVDPPGIRTVIAPEIDSKHPRLLEFNRALDAGQLPAGFEDFIAEIKVRLQAELLGYDVCVAHNAFTMHKNLPLTAALHRLAAELPGLRFIAWCHDLAWTNSLYAPVLHDAWPWNLLRQPAPGVRYVAISPLRQQEILDSFRPAPAPADIPVVPNGVHLAEFLKLGAETVQVLQAVGLENPAAADPLLLLPARITRRKNIELGIRVIAALKDRGVPARLLVTGPPGPHNPKNDEYVRELLALRAELEVEDRVIFLMERWQTEDGRPRTLPDEVIADLYRVADALFFPSAQEGFGIPVLEAGLARLPVFCARLDPFVEIAGELPCYFEPEADPQQVADLILNRLAADQQHRLRRRVIENYSWESIFENHLRPLVSG